MRRLIWMLPIIFMAMMLPLGNVSAHDDSKTKDLEIEISHDPGAVLGPGDVVDFELKFKLDDAVYAGSRVEYSEYWDKYFTESTRRFIETMSGTDAWIIPQLNINNNDTIDYPTVIKCPLDPKMCIKYEYHIPNTNEEKMLEITDITYDLWVDEKYTYYPDIEDVIDHKTTQLIFNQEKFDLNVFIDTKPPRVSVSESEIKTYKKYHKIILTAIDREGVDPVDDITLRYKWTKSETAPNPDDIDGVGASSGKAVPMPENPTGEYYLHILATDDIGNESVTSFGPYYFDHTKPSLDFEVQKNEGDALPRKAVVDLKLDDACQGGLEKCLIKTYEWQSNQPININLKATDTHSGIEKIEYKWSNQDVWEELDLSNPTVQTPRSGLVGAPNEGRFQLSVRVTDQAENQNVFQSINYLVDQSVPSVEFYKQNGKVDYLFIPEEISYGERIDRDSEDVYEWYDVSYQWTESPDPSTINQDEWVYDRRVSQAYLGGTVAFPTEVGEWYLHLKVVDDFENVEVYSFGEPVLGDVEPQYTLYPNGNNNYEQEVIVEIKDNGFTPEWVNYYIVDQSGNRLTGNKVTSDGEIEFNEYRLKEIIPDNGIVRIEIVSDEDETELISNPYLMDFDPPEGTANFVEDATNQSTATIIFDVEDDLSGVSQIRFDANTDVSCLGRQVQPDAEWMDYPSDGRLEVNFERPYTTYYSYTIEFKDEAGNITRYPTHEETDNYICAGPIIYDEDPPVIVDDEDNNGEIDWDESIKTYPEYSNDFITIDVAYNDRSPEGENKLCSKTNEEGKCIKSVKVYENGTHTIKVTDEAGNSDSVKVTINEIDREKPVIELVDLDELESGKEIIGKRKSVRIITSITEDTTFTTESAWSQNGNAPPTNGWKEGSESELTDADGVWYLWAKVTDSAGNVSTKVSEPFFLDNTPPSGTIEYSTTSRTSSPVEAYLHLSEPAEIIEPQNGLKTYTFNENGAFTFKFKDAVGNIGEVTATVDWIDNSLPRADVTLSPDSWTNEPVTVTVSVYGEPSKVLSNIRAPEYAELIQMRTKEHGVITDPVEGATVTEVVYRFPTNGIIFYTIDDLETGLTNDTSTFVNRIDRKAPTGELIYSPSTWTSDDVTVTLQVYDERSDVNIIEGGESFTFTENGTHKFVFEDAAGNRNELTANVDWIDREAPIPSIRYSETSWTDQSVTASVYFENEPAPVIITNNDGSDEYTFEQNGSFTFYYEDQAGHSGQIEAKVDWIDKQKLEPVIHYSPNTWTTESVTASVYFGEHLSPITITNNGGNDTYTFNENGSFTFEYKNAAGFVGKKTATVDWIDRTAPEANIQYSVPPSGATNGSVRAILKPNEPVTVLNTPNGQTFHDFDDNGTFTFEFVDRTGNRGTSVATVENIDRDPPTPKVTYSYTGTEKTKESIVATVSADEPIYVLNNGRRHQYVFEENGSFTFIVQDLAGNQAEIEASVTQIDKSKANITVHYSETEPTKNSVTATVKSDRPLSILDNDGSSEVIFDKNGSTWLHAKDELGNEYFISMKVTNIDREAPVINFEEGPNLVIPVGSDIKPLQSVSVTDNVDGDLTNRVNIEHHIDPNTPGEYVMTYEITDRAGNKTIVERTAIVIAPDELVMYINSQPAPDGEADVRGDHVFIDYFAEQGESVLKWAYGRLDIGEFKANHQVIENGTLAIEKQGYYTFLVQDQERNNRLVHVYVIPNY